jgi:hypothetical protein
VTKYLDGVIEGDQPQWAVNQKAMVNAGIYYRKTAKDFEIRSMQEFFELSYQGLDEDGQGRLLNVCLKIENAREEEIWRQEEMAETALEKRLPGDTVCGSSWSTRKAGV